ncbi:hypothetical protein HK100_002303 [Physocladia obscura]|uniref:Apple domain-containing protein n=1 Tax=Physocladia obscura TaxID=109957 RepID=A0AAD5SVK7_9FUNG|nr:hypothetical protein HK100_002303 [Physocladia obscura]
MRHTVNALAFFKPFFLFFVSFLFLLVAAVPLSEQRVELIERSIVFQTGSNGAVEYSANCDWPGGDIGNALTSSSNCGSTCVAYSGCTHFTWSIYSGGTCWFKSNNVLGPAFPASQTYCGYTTATVTITFQNGNNGAVQWASACDWLGGDIANVAAPASVCGSACLNQIGCTRFSWTNYNGGTCWLKNDASGAAIYSNSASAICGYTTVGQSIGITNPSPQSLSPQSQTSSAVTNILITGSGVGSYYYDVTGITCNNNPPYAETNGYAFCEPGTGYKTLAQRGNNYIVALAVDQMNSNKAGLCGKQVIVSYNGKVVPEIFVIWDACAACSGGVRLDFSVTALLGINPNACALGLVPGITWQVTDTQIIPYVQYG